MEEFAAQEVENLGHYVYALVDPDKNNKGRAKVFYIGKGKGQRCHQHAYGADRVADSSTGDMVDSPKLGVIRKIISDGSWPEVRVVAHGLESANAALQIESILMKVASLDGVEFVLTNLQAGHHSDDYWLDRTAIAERYGEPIPRLSLPKHILLVSLNKTFAAAASENDLLRATLGNWACGVINAPKVKYIIGVHGQLMRTFYKVDESYCELQPQKPNGHPRFRWSGDVARDLQGFRNRSLVGENSKGATTTLTKFGSGQGCRFLP